MHISKDIIGSKSSCLKGRKITLCLTGSVAVIRTVELAREFMRLGAEVFPVMTEAARGLITPEFMEWATGNKTVTELTGRVEHIELAGNIPDKSDLILVAPATANTISKAACGIDDTPVTTVLTTGIGEGIPVIFVPAMHLAMYHHPILHENIKKLKSIGIHFLDSRIEEGKAKIAGNEEIVRYATNLLCGSSRLKGKKILITAGPTIEYIDPVRIISNKSSGKMGTALAEEALKMGASVTLVYGPGSARPPVGIKVISVETSKQMYDAVTAELSGGDYNFVIAAAAVSDWQVDNYHEDKISTHKNDEISLTLKPTVKIIDRIKETAPNVKLVCFRALSGLANEALIENAYNRLLKAKGDFIVVNDVAREGAGFDVDTNEVFVIDRERNVTHLPLTSKKLIARGILEVL